MLQIRIVCFNRLSLFGVFQSVTLVSCAELDHTFAGRTEVQQAMPIFLDFHAVLT